MQHTATHLHLNDFTYTYIYICTSQHVTTICGWVVWTFCYIHMIYVYIYKGMHVESHKKFICTSQRITSSADSASFLFFRFFSFQMSISTWMTWHMHIYIHISQNDFYICIYICEMLQHIVTHSQLNEFTYTYIYIYMYITGRYHCLRMSGMDILWNSYDICVCIYIRACVLRVTNNMYVHHKTLSHICRQRLLLSPPPDILVILNMHVLYIYIYIYIYIYHIYITECPYHSSADNASFFCPLQRILFTNINDNMGNLMYIYIYMCMTKYPYHSSAESVLDFPYFPTIVCKCHP